MVLAKHAVPGNLSDQIVRKSFFIMLRQRACLATLFVLAVAAPCAAAASSGQMLMPQTSFCSDCVTEFGGWSIAGAVLFGVLQAGLLVGLWVNRVQRRQEEAEATLIADISSKFVHLAPGAVDLEIMDAQRRICALLGLDMSALWQWSDEVPGGFTLTHFYSVQLGPQPPGQLTQEDFPWIAQQMLAGRIVALASLEELPAAAAHDHEVARQLGIKSSLCLPLTVGGMAPVGVLGLNTMRAQRHWPPALVKQLRLVAQIFTYALARKFADQALRASEEALRASELRLVAGAELAGLGYYEVDFSEATVFVDDRFHEICGVPSGHYQGLQSLEFWMDHLHPDDRQYVLDEREKLHDGRMERMSIEYRYLHPAHGQKWIYHLAGAATRSTTGHALRTYGVLRDITQRRLAEQEAMELRGNLAHAGRVTLLGQLASALAHELSQPLGAVLRNAEAAEILLQAPVPDVEELRAIVTDILHDDQRAGQVIDRLRSLLQRRSVDIQALDLHAVIGEVLPLVHADAAARHVTLAFSVTPELPMVMGDRVHLQQVLLNLLVNAMDALEANPIDQRSVQVSARQSDPHTVEVRVTDNGPGVAGEFLQRLFEPFFTTKTNGMGMGLPVSKTLIEAHRGRLWTEPAPDGGACFCFTVPVASY